MRLRVLFSVVVGIAVAVSGCSIKKFAVNQVGDALSESGSTYSGDEDIELVGEALPFALKLIESLLEVSPEHRGMLLTACEGFTTYSYVYVQSEAEVLAELDLAEARRMKDRSRKLYLRALGYCLRGLDVDYPGAADGLATDSASALAEVKERDLPLLYWTAASLGLAISVSKDDAAMLARIPDVEALLERGLELDDTWNEGSLYEFEVILSAARPGRPDFDAIDRDYLRALELSEGQRAGLFVAYAEAVPLRQQDRAEFLELLDRALEVDADARVEFRLANLVAQRRATWLKSRMDDLFLEPEGPEGSTQ